MTRTLCHFISRVTMDLSGAAMVPVTKAGCSHCFVRNDQSKSIRIKPVSRHCIFPARICRGMQVLLQESSATLIEKAERLLMGYLDMLGFRAILHTEYQKACRLTAYIAVSDKRLDNLLFHSHCVGESLLIVSDLESDVSSAARSEYMQMQ